MGVSTFSMFVWAPSRCPPFRPEALQPASAGHNNFGTVQEGGFLSAASMPKSLVSSRRLKTEFLLGERYGLQHSYRFRRFGLKNSSHPLVRFGLLKIRLVQPDKGNKSA
jgi:hypothetical protein